MARALHHVADADGASSDVFPEHRGHDDIWSEADRPCTPWSLATTGVGERGWQHGSARNMNQFPPRLARAGAGYIPGLTPQTRARACCASWGVKEWRRDRSSCDARQVSEPFFGEHVGNVEVKGDGVESSRTEKS